MLSPHYIHTHTHSHTHEGIEMLTNLIVIVLQNNMYLVITLYTLNSYMLYVNDGSMKFGKFLKLKINEKNGWAKS